MAVIFSSNVPVKNEAVVLVSRGPCQSVAACSLGPGSECISDTCKSQCSPLRQP